MIFTVKIMTIYDKTNNIILPLTINNSLKTFIQRFDLECNESREIVKDIMIITPLSHIEYSCHIINDSKWSGRIDRFTYNVTNDKDFIDLLIQTERWNGDCSYFSTTVTKNPEVVCKIIKSGNWNGRCEYFDCLNDITCLNAIVQSPQWDGDASFFTNKDPRLYFSVINSPYWDGEANFPVNDLELYHQLIHHDKWNGSIEYFPNSLLYDKDFCNKLVTSSIWNFDLTRIPYSIISDEEFSSKLKHMLSVLDKKMIRFL